MKPIEFIKEQYIQYRIMSSRKPNLNTGLRYFLDWVTKEYPTEKYFTQEMVDKWLIHRDGESPISYQTRYYHTISILRFARERQWTSVMEPMPPRPAKSTYLPHIFTQIELANFFRACDEYSEERFYFVKSQRRHHLMTIEAPIFYRLMYSTGMRPPEVRCLMRSDVNFDNGEAKIHNTKGYNEHLIVLHDTMLELLRLYDADMDNIMPNRIYMFPDENDQPYTTSSQNRLFQRLWHKYNESDCVAYCFRHNYAITNINKLICRGIEANEELMALCRSMGHASFQETMHYYSMVPNFGKLLDDLCDNDLEEILPTI